MRFAFALPVCAINIAILAGNRPLPNARLLQLRIIERVYDDRAAGKALPIWSNPHKPATCFAASLQLIEVKRLDTLGRQNRPEP